MRVRHGVILAALVLPLLLAATPAGAARAQWWGPLEAGDGHHLRVGAVVRSPGAALPANTAVALEVDLGQALADAGWPHATVAGTDRVQGFRLDEASVRVVAMTDLAPSAPGTAHGRLRAVDLSFEADDPRRYEAPSQAYLGSLSSHVPYHPAANPVVTVVWRVAEPMAAGEERSYFVYFDSLQSADPKPPADPSATLLGGDSLGLFWSGWGTTLHGFSKPIDGKASPVVVVAQRAGTDVEVLAAEPGRPFQRLEAFRLDGALSSRQVAVPGTSALLLKVQASGPVLAQATSTGFVPSLDAGFTGRDFVFAMTHPAGWEQDTLYFAATDPGDADGDLQPTTVEVTRLDGSMAPARFQLGGANPHDYNVGARASIVRGQCTRPVPGGASPELPFGPGLYRARVLSGERVLLQHQAVDGLSQVPSVTGAPTGERFLAAFAWTDETGLDSSCGLETRPGTLFAANAGGSTVLNVTSDDLVFQAYPRGSPNPVAARFPPGRIVGGDRTLQGPYEVTARDSADRMLKVQATDPLMLLLGQGRQQTGVRAGSGSPPYTDPVFGSSNVPVVNGPLGGTGGARSFTGLGPAVLVSPFNDNAVTVELRYATGWQTRATTLSRDAAYELGDASASNPLLDFRVRSRFPLVVHPALASSGTFAAVPALLQATAAGASFRGYLLDLSSPDGDPATRSTAPGLPATYPVTLSNLAQDAAGQLLEDQALVTADAPAGWTVRLDGASLEGGKSVPLAPGQAKPMVVTVVPPATVAGDTTQAITLRAASKGNERVADVLQLVTFVKTEHKIDLWFDAVGLAKEQELQVDGQGLAEFHLVLHNGGTRTERVELAVALRGGAAGWQAGLGERDAEVLQVDVEPGPDGLALDLRMRAPEGAPDAETTAVVTAKIVAAPANKDAVQATAVRRAPADVSLLADRLAAFAAPGKPADFRLTVASAVGGPVRLEVQGGTGPGWVAPVLTRGDPPTPADRLTLTAGQRIDLRLSVTPDAAALAGNTTTVRVAAVDRDGNTREAVLFVKVLPRHALAVTATPGTVGVAGPGASASFTLRWANSGNLAEHLALVPADLPAGWTLNLTKDLVVPRDGAKDVTVQVAVPKGAAAGLQGVSILGVTADGNRTLVRVPVSVDDLSLARLGPTPDAVQAQPGALVATRARVANNGTVPLKVSVAAAPGEPWKLADGPSLLLRPNEEADLVLRWQVPADAADGISVHRAVLRLDDGASQLPPQDVRAAIDVGRADLRVLQAAAAAGPAGGLVRATIANAGARPALGFVVQAHGAGGEVLDEVAVAHLAAGANVTVTLAVRGPTSALVLDAAQAVPEGDETDNQAPIAWDAPQEAPGAGLGLLILLFALAATRRRTTEQPPGDA